MPPTSKQLADQIRRTLSARKQDVAGMVVSAAFHIVHDSQMYGTTLWPKNDFVAGYGIECNVKDRIYIGINAYGIDQDPVTGLLLFNIHNTPFPRHKKQQQQIRLIMDQAIYNNIRFDDEYKTDFVNNPWFTFTINN